MSNDNITKAARFISQRLQCGQLNEGTKAGANEDKDNGSHPLMPSDKKSHHAVHRALRAVHSAVFDDPENNTVEKAKNAHSILTNAAKPQDDNEVKGK